MARSLKAVRPRGESTGFGNWLARFFGRRKRPTARIDALNERMLRDIGLADKARSELGKIERLRGP